MAKKSTGVYVVDKFNEQYELNEYQIFVQKECAKLQKKNIHISGSGNTLVYIGELWQKKKAKEAAKAERDEKARIRKMNDVILPSSTCTYSTAAEAKKAEAAAKQKLKKQQEEEAEKVRTAEAKKAEAAAKRKLKKQQEEAEKERALKEADAVAERILREKAAKKAEDDKKFYVNNTSYFSNTPTSKRFIGVQV